MFRAHSIQPPSLTGRGGTRRERYASCGHTGGLSESAINEERKLHINVFFSVLYLPEMFSMAIFDALEHRSGLS